MTDVPPGWYDDPENATRYRYWDGTTWTEHRAPKAVTVPLATADATAVISRGFDLFKQTWVQQLIVAVIAGVVALAGGIVAFIGIATGLEPDLFDIIDRVTEPGFDPDTDPADDAFLDSITIDWGAGPILAIVVGALLLYGAIGLGFATALVHVARVSHGGTEGLGASFRYCLRNLVRWIGILLLWGLVGTVAIAVHVGVFIALTALSPLFLILLIPATLAAVVYVWPFLHIAGSVLVLAPRDMGPARRTIGLVRPRWPGFAGRVLLVSVVIFAVNLASNIAALIPILGILVVLAATFAIYAFQVTTNVALYAYLEGPLDDEVTV